MRVFHGVLLACLVVLGAENARADEVAVARKVLSLNDVLASVEQSFPLLRAAELERAIASADLLSAEGGFDLSWKTRGAVTPVGYYESVRVESMVEKPTALWGASAFAGWKLGTGEFPLYDGRQQTLEYGEVRAGVNLPLLRNGPIDRRRASLDRAEIGRDVASLTVAEQRILYRCAAAHRYFAWVAAGQRLAIARVLFRNVEGRDAALSARVESGDLPPIERSDNARAIEQRRAQLALAERGVEQGSIELALFLRDASGRPLIPTAEQMPERLPEPASNPAPMGEGDVRKALAARPEARRLELQLRQNQIEIDWAKNQLAPGIDVQVAGSRDLGPGIASRPDLSQPVLEVAVLVDIPLQTRLMQGRVDAASASSVRLEHQRAFAADRITADVRDALSAIRAARERIEATKREVAIALELEEAERTRFEQGDSQLLLVNLREQQTAEAELREVDALLDYHRGIADLQAARGDREGPAAQ